MPTRERDPYRARDYDGLVHFIGIYAYMPYACNTVHCDDAANHGVWTDEATTCIWCAAERKAP